MKREHAAAFQTVQISMDFNHVHLKPLIQGVSLDQEHDITSGKVINEVGGNRDGATGPP